MKKILCAIMASCMLPCLCACKAEEKPAETTQKTSVTSSLQTEDPAKDDSLNVLFINNSTSYYFLDELYGVLTAAGYENVNLCLAYYSGCSLKQHYEFWQSKQAPYQFRIANKNGINMTPNTDLDTALRAYNWDVIATACGGASLDSGDLQTAYKADTEPYLGKILDYVQGLFPMSRYIWIQKWANDVGGVTGYAVKTVEQRKAAQKILNEIAQLVKKNYGMEIAPCSDAWDKVRDLELFNTLPEGCPLEKFSMFSRLQDQQVMDDHIHDGDIGGGQYLNACVWFEVLTGESCIGNTFRPKYTYQAWDWSLSEEKIDILQKAAHEAVAEIK